MSQNPDEEELNPFEGVENITEGEQSLDFPQGGGSHTQAVYQQETLNFERILKFSKKEEP